jgi:hypothetical protein
VYWTDLFVLVTSRIEILDKLGTKGDDDTKAILKKITQKLIEKGEKYVLRLQVTRLKTRMQKIN